MWNNNNYPTEEEGGEDKEDYPPSHSFSNKSNKIAKILVWEFQLYKLNEKLEEEGTNDWGQQQLNKEERANVILISELFSWLTLKEHFNVNLKKAVGLLIALRESDRILQNANFLCSVFNYLKRIEGEKELLNRWTLDELKINFWNVLEIEEVFLLKLCIVNRISLLNYRKYSNRSPAPIEAYAQFRSPPNGTH